MTRQSDFAGKVLAGVDPTQAPLPNGTEVVTRIDRMLADRRVPMGAVGRVIAREDDWCDVAIVGVGTVRYRRDELLPRKAGQARFAQRREAAWQLLTPCIVLEATVGSRAWGLEDRGSDTDLRGVFVLPFPWTATIAEPVEDLTSADGSASYWEAGKAFRQALRADPNTLELFFVDTARAKDPMGEIVLAARDACVSRHIYGSFGRYALSQLKKLRQSLRLAEHRSTILEWLRNEPALDLDAVAARLVEHTRARAASEQDALFQAKEYVKQLYRSLYDMGLVTERDFSALRRFAERAHLEQLDLPRELRPKNAYNLLRLLMVAIAWLRDGRVSLRVEGDANAKLRAIKRGEVALDVVLEEAERLSEALERARNDSPLPLQPDVTRVDAALREIREQAAARWLARAKSPFGVDAPPPPVIDWEGS